MISSQREAGQDPASQRDTASIRSKDLSSNGEEELQGEKIEEKESRSLAPKAEIPKVVAPEQTEKDSASDSLSQHGREHKGVTVSDSTPTVEMQAAHMSNTRLHNSSSTTAKVSNVSQAAHDGVRPDALPSCVDAHESTRSLQAGATQSVPIDSTPHPASQTQPNTSIPPQNRNRQQSRQKGRFFLQCPSEEEAAQHTVLSSAQPQEENSRPLAPQHVVPPQSTIDSTQAVPPGQVVTKKKGRFQFLDAAPINSPQKEKEVKDESVPSPKSTNDAPVVRQKGRFMVTSVPVKAVVTTTHQMIAVEQNAHDHGPVDSGQVTAGQLYTTTSPVMMAPNGQMYYAAPQPPQPDTISMAVAMPQQQHHADRSGATAVHMPSMTSVPQQSQRLSPAPPHTNTMAEAEPPIVRQISADLGGPDDMGAAATVPKKQKDVSKVIQQQQQHSRTSKVSTGRQASPGWTGQQSFGKMYCFLDQMRLEVSEADRTVRSLQIDMKCIKEKNKELEAKARDTERKWLAEKSLREATETKLKELRKKLRSMKVENDHGIVDTMKEDESIGTQQTSGHLSRANSSDGFDGANSAVVDDLSFPNLEPSKSAGALHGLSADHPSAINAYDTTPTSKLASDSTGKSPPRSSTIKKFPSSQQKQRSPVPTSMQQKSATGSSSIPIVRPNMTGNSRGVTRSKSTNGTIVPPKQNVLRPTAPNANTGLNDAGLNATNIDPSAASQPVPAVVNLVAPPRPAVRNDSATSIGSVKPAAPATDFDPLRPPQETQDINSLLVEQDGYVHMYTNGTPLYMMNQQQMLPVVGVSQPTVPASDLMTFQSPVLHTEESFSDPAIRNQQILPGHRQAHSTGMLIVPSHAMRPYQDQPTIDANSKTGRHDVQVQQPPHLVTIQPPMIQIEHQQKPMSNWPNDQQQQQWIMGQEKERSNDPHYQNDWFGEQHSKNENPSRKPQQRAQSSGLVEPQADPFDELVQQRRPTQSLK